MRPCWLTFSHLIIFTGRKKMQLGRTAAPVMRRRQANCFSCKPFPPSLCEEGDMGQPLPQGAHLRDLGEHRGKLVTTSVLQLCGNQEPEAHVCHQETEAQAAEMAQSVKYLLHKPKVSGSIPSNHIKQVLHGCTGL